MRAVVVIAIAFLGMCSGNSVYGPRFDELLGLSKDTLQLQDYGKRNPNGKIESECMKYKYGCCPDGKTQATGSLNEGCGMKLCIDERVLWCKQQRQSQCQFETTYKTCQYKCNPQCKKSAFKPKCDPKKYPFGCCWNGMPKVSFNEKCPPCQDTPDMAPICQQFSEQCEGGYYGITEFLERHCKKTCGHCG